MLGKIFPKSLVPGQKSDQNPTITRHVFMNFKVQKSRFLMSGPLFVYSLIKCYALFIKKSPKTLCLTKVTSQSLMPRQKLTPEKPNTFAGTSVTTVSGNLTLPLPPLRQLILFPRLSNNLIKAFITDKYINI